MTPLVFLRHGQSVWNQARRFTGWADVPLSPHGREQARQAAHLIRTGSFAFDMCFTSCLQRATDTLQIVLTALDLEQSPIPVHRSWRLNERHYGALQGLSRQDVAQQYGYEQVVVWQQHFDIAPPALDPTDPRAPSQDPRYADLTDVELPRTETLKDVRARVLPYWHDVIVPEIKNGRQIFMVAHGNSLRALTTYLDGVAAEDIPQVKRPLTGEPFVYEFDQAAVPRRRYSLRRAPKLQRWLKSKLGQLHLRSKDRSCAE